MVQPPRWIARGPVMMHDDRGRRVPLLDLSGEDFRDPTSAPLRDAVVRAAEATTDTSLGRKLTRHDLLFFGTFLLCFVLLIAAQSVWPGVPGWLRFVIMPAAILSLSWMHSRQHLRSHAAKYAATLLAHGRCASCGYALAGTPEDQFGLAQCPECGAVWKGERIGGVKALSAGLSGAPADSPVGRGLGYRALWDRAPSVLDANNRALPLIEPGKLRAELEARFPREVADQLLGELRRTTRGHAIRASLLMGFGVVVYGLLFLQSSGLLTGRPGWRTPWMAVLVIAMCLVVPMWVIQVRRAFRGQAQRTAPDVAKLLVLNGLCPACGGELPAADSPRGVTTCVCGAAWVGSLKAPIK